jgi:hypothetical protein
MDKQNVYQKLQAARIELQKMPIKESGNNAFAKYTYMEIGDFIGKANIVLQAHGLIGTVSYAADLATLVIVNMDNPTETIAFTTPMSTADLKGCHPVQSHGAVMTYLRRYLWITALELTEHDALDMTVAERKTDKPPVDLDQDTIDAINSTGTLDELTAIWKRIDVGLRHGYTPIFSARKKELGGANA